MVACTPCFASRPHSIIPKLPLLPFAMRIGPVQRVLSVGGESGLLPAALQCQARDKIMLAK